MVFQEKLREEQRRAVELTGPFFGGGEQVFEELGAQGLGSKFGVVQGSIASGFTGGTLAKDEDPLVANGVRAGDGGAPEFGKVRGEGGVESVQLRLEEHVFAFAKYARAFGENFVVFGALFAVGGMDCALDFADFFHDVEAVVLLGADAGFLDT